MPRKPHESRINSNLAEYAEWDEDIEYEMDDAVATEFFHEMVELVRERLNAVKVDDPVALAFKDASLSPSDPFNWLRLVEAFADVHYRRKKPGPTQYKEAFRKQLWERLKSVIDKQTTRNLSEACRNVVKSFPEYTRKGEDSGRAAKRLRDAINDFEWTKDSFDHRNPPPFLGK